MFFIISAVLIGERFCLGEKIKGAKFIEKKESDLYENKQICSRCYNRVKL